ncbi:MAG: hypothetical protein V3S64_05950 [bacterium]
MWTMPSRIIILLLFSMVLAFSAYSAKEIKVDVRESDSMGDFLARKIGRKIEVILISGKSLKGKIKFVGRHVVQLSKLTGKEFFDAVIRIDSISAVVLRVRGR